MMRPGKVGFGSGNLEVTGDLDENKVMEWWRLELSHSRLRAEWWEIGGVWMNLPKMAGGQEQATQDKVYSSPMEESEQGSPPYLPFPLKQSPRNLVNLLNSQ